MAKKKQKKRVKLTPKEKELSRRNARFKKNINTVFTNAGFLQLPVRDNYFDLAGRQLLELDAIFIYKNLIVISEDVTRQPGKHLRDHLNNKAIIFSHIKGHQKEFVEFLENKYDKFKRHNNGRFRPNEFKLIFIYCSYHTLEQTYKDRHKEIIYLNYPELQYFLKLSKTINLSVKYELFKFLKLSLSNIGYSQAGDLYKRYPGFLLPDSPSGYPEGYKIVSFLIEPQALLEQSYVLRKDGWLDTDCLYQRMLIPGKIKKMREYLTTKERVFVNNIIASLPARTKLMDKNDKEIGDKSPKKQDVTIMFPEELNTIGIIDGQHRTFSYHEGGDKYDKTIAPLRKKQHLLLTGIIHPQHTSEHQKTKFEAQLFLEINDKQTRTKADLKQAIEILINPFSSIAVSKKILLNLSKNGALAGHLEVYFFDTKKIKTSSIVSYGLKHIVKCSGDDSFYAIWIKRGKEDLIKKHDKQLLDEYVKYCTKEIQIFISAFKDEMDEKGMWTLDKKVSRVLTTTTINGLIFCMRKLIKNRKLKDRDGYKKGFKKLEVKFTPNEFRYKSSHWKDLGDKIYAECFE